jgi:hypothetical protein
MDSSRINYYSYLLLLWQVREGSGSHFRASLEDVQTGELVGFKDMDALQGYLDHLAIAKQMHEQSLESREDRDG